MRTAFLGTSEFAAAVLERLAAGPHRPALVITRPDRPSGRGRRLTAPPVADAARRLEIELAQPQGINDPDTLAAIERHAGQADSVACEDSMAPRDAVAPPHAAAPRDAAGGTGVAVVVCAFGALIKEPLLSAHPMLNVHPSLLPRWRGAAPIERAIMAGDEQTGVSIMRLTAGLDSGPVCRAVAEPLAPEDTYGSLAPRLAALGGDLLVDVLDAWERGEPPQFVEQDETAVTYAEKIGAADRLLDPARGARELECVVRALHPHIGARIALGDGTALGVQRARVDGTASHVPPVGALAAVEGRLLYGTAEGALELLEVQAPGGRPMQAVSYMRGHALPSA